MKTLQTGTKVMMKLSQRGGEVFWEDTDTVKTKGWMLACNNICLKV